MPVTTSQSVATLSLASAFAVSRPPPHMRVSLPGPPTRRSFPGPPTSRSFPASPYSLSFPPFPYSASAAGVPRSVSFRAVPVIVFAQTAPARNVRARPRKRDHDRQAQPRHEPHMLLAYRRARLTEKEGCSRRLGLGRLTLPLANWSGAGACLRTLRVSPRYAQGVRT